MTGPKAVVSLVDPMTAAELVVHFGGEGRRTEGGLASAVVGLYHVTLVELGGHVVDDHLAKTDDFSLGGGDVGEIRGIGGSRGD